MSAGPAFSLRLLVQRVGGVAGSTVASQVMTGLVYVLAARALGPEAFGRVAVAVAVATVAAVVFDLGLTDMVTRDVAGGRLAVGTVRSLLWRKRVAGPGLVVVVGAMSVVAGNGAVAGLVFGGVSWALWEAQTANGLLRGRERFRAAIACQLTGRALGLAVALGVGAVGWSPVAFAACLLLGPAGEAVAGQLRLRREDAGGVDAGDAPRGLVRTQAEAMPYGMTGLAASAQQLDTPAVSAAAGAAEAGIYAAAGRLIGPLNFAGTALALVAMPWLARAQHDHVLRRQEERKVDLLSLAIFVVPLMVGFGGQWLLPLVLGRAYAGSGAVFVLLAMGSSVTAVNQGAATILQARRRQGAVAAIVAGGLAVGLAATFGLGLLAGAVGAAFALIASQALILVLLRLRLRAIRRHDRVGPTAHEDAPDEVVPDLPEASRRPPWS